MRDPVVVRSLDRVVLIKSSGINERGVKEGRLEGGGVSLVWDRVFCTSWK